MFGTNVLILHSVELQWGLHLRLFDIINETRRDLCSKKIQFILSAPHFIYFSKGSSGLLHRTHANTNGIYKWGCERWRKHFKNKIWDAIESNDHCLLSYLRSVDRGFDQSSTPDNIQDVNGIEDDEHRYDQVQNKHCLKIDMEQVQNKSPRESHKYQCY